MIEFKIGYIRNHKKHNIVGITNGAMNEPVHDELHRENQLTEVNVYKDNQRPNERWNIGPSYIHSLYFDNQGVTLYFKLSTYADGKIKSRDFIGMVVYEEDEDTHAVNAVNVPYSVQTRYIE
jgi:hypothetical protein